MRNYSKFSFDDFSGDCGLVLEAAFHAEFAQILLETVLDLVYRRDSNVVRVDSLSGTELEGFLGVVASGKSGGGQAGHFVARADDDLAGHDVHEV